MTDDLKHEQAKDLKINKLLNFMEDYIDLCLECLYVSSIY